MDTEHNVTVNRQAERTRVKTISRRHDFSDDRMLNKGRRNICHFLYNSLCVHILGVAILVGTFGSFPPLSDNLELGLELCSD